MVIVLAVMIKSYVNKILEPSYLGIFPWVTKKILATTV